MAIIKTSWTKANDDNEKDNYKNINPSGFLQNNMILFQINIYTIDVI